MKLENGKLDSGLLEKLLAGSVCDDDSVIVGPKVGADCAFIKLEEGVYAVGGDPITFEVTRPGYYAIHVNANDVAVSGAIPSYYTQTIILPTGTELCELEAIMEDSVNTAKELGITLIGGHTEISDVVKRPLISICMFGKTIKKVNLPENIQSGDVIVQINSLAMEGTAILAEMFSDKLLLKYDEEYIQKAKDLIYYPGLSIVKPAVYASKELPVKLMHDPTEGGILTALREIAVQTNCGLLVEENQFIIREETINICKECGCDPLGLISSGTLLAVFSEKDAGDALNSFVELGYRGAVVARFTDFDGEYKSVKNGETSDLREFKVDELYSITNA
jgi:hydrogenase maturation factor